MAIELPTGVEATVSPTGLTRYEISTPACTATVYAMGATVASWAPAHQPPILFAGEFEPVPGKAIRGGIPICSPWFGPSPQGLPAPQAHGYVRTADWRLTQAAAIADDIQLTFELDGNSIDPAQRVAALPSDLKFSLTATFGSHLDVTLRVQSPTSQCLVASALHTYLAVSDVTDVLVLGLEGKPYVDKTADWERGVQAGPVSFVSETDRVYDTADPVRVIDGDRVVTVTTDAANVIVWNPWAENAARMGDLSGDEWRRFVCVESGNVLANATLLSPGEVALISTRIESTIGS